MDEYQIKVNQVEQLQMTNSVVDLQQILKRAHSTVIQGGTVVLVRDNADGSSYNVDEISTEDALKRYKDSVLQYLDL
jgi:hypothetical protein